MNFASTWKIYLNTAFLSIFADRRLCTGYSTKGAAHCFLGRAL